MATGCAPTFEEIALTDSLTAWAAAVEGASRVVDRRDSPWRNAG